MGDPLFSVSRGVATISGGSTTVTIIEGVDYSLVNADASAAFVRIVNSYNTGDGPSNAAGDQKARQWTVFVNNPGNILTSLTFERANSSSGVDCRIEWEVVECLDTSSPDGFIVRNVQTINLAAGTVTGTGTTVTTISDINQAVLFITGQNSNINTQGEVRLNRSLFTGEFVANASDWDPTVVRFNGANAIADVSIAVVEFGSNWTVQRVEWTTDTFAPTSAWTSGSPNNSNTATLTSLGGTALTDYKKAFIHHQFDNASGSTLDTDEQDALILSGNNQLTLWTASLNALTERSHVMWICENANAIAEHLDVYRATTGSEEDVWTTAVNTVRELDEASIFPGLASATDSGSAPNIVLSVGHELTGASTAQHRRAFDDEPVHAPITVFQWPQTTTNPGGLLNVGGCCQQKSSIWI